MLLILYPFTRLQVFQQPGFLRCRARAEKSYSQRALGGRLIKMDSIRPFVF